MRCRPRCAHCLQRGQGKELWQLAVTGGQSRSVAPIPVRADSRFSADGAVVNARLITASTGFRGISGTAFRRQVDVSTGRLIVDEKEGESAYVDGGGVAAALRSTFSDDGRWRHISRQTKKGERTHLVDLRTGRNVGRDIPGAVAASHAGVNRVVIVGARLMTLAEADSGRAIETFVGMAARFSLDGTRLFVIRETFGEWTLFDAVTGLIVAEAPRDTPFALAWALTTDGQRLATIEQDKLILAEARPPIVYKTVTPGDVTVATLGDVASARDAARPDEGLLKVVSAMSGERLMPAAAFTGNGRWLVARAGDAQIDVWDTATGNRMPFRLPSSSLSAARSSSVSRSSLQVWRPTRGSRCTSRDWGRWSSRSGTTRMRQAITAHPDSVVIGLVVAPCRQYRTRSCCSWVWTPRGEDAASVRMESTRD